MRLRSHRGNLLLSNLTAPAGEPGATRQVRPGRIRRGLSTGALLSVIGTRRFARIAHTRWQPVFLVIGALAVVTGLMLRSSVAFVLGMLVMGSAAPDIGSHSPTAATVRTWMWLHKNRAGTP